MNTIWNREAPSIIVPHQTELSAPERPGIVPVRIITEQETKEGKKEEKKKRKKSINSRGDEVDVNTIVNHNNMGIHAGAA